MAKKRASKKKPVATAVLPTIDELAQLSPTQLKQLLYRMSSKTAEALLHDWHFLAREAQLPPEGDWRTWLFLAGRGSGKTRAACEWVRDRVKQGFRRIGIIAPTAGDARDVVVEGESGLLSVCWERDGDEKGKLTGRPHYEPSKRRVTWGNGAMATLYSADEPERLRGPQHDSMIMDELAAWRFGRETYDNAMFGLRLGDDPRLVITTTPKPLSLLREIVAAPTTVITRGSTYDNRAHLAEAFLAQIVQKYEGTRLGRQELYADLLEEAEGALWKRADLERCIKPAPDTLSRIVVAVDPAISANAESNETGIVVAGREPQTTGRGYVLADLSGRYTPAQWAERVAGAYEEWGADRIVAEGNQGGELVRRNIQVLDAALPIRIVKASRGKAARAEPVAAMYEQGRIHHAESFPELEDQLVMWEPLSGVESPDRLDALVWAITDLFLSGAGTRSIGAAPEVYTGGR